MKNLLILIVLFSQQLFAKSSSIDSLWTEYHKITSDSQKVNILIKKILPLYTQQHSDSGIKYYKHATNIILTLLKKENDKNIKLFYLHNLLKVIQKIGSLYDDIGNKKISMQYNHKLYRLCKIILKYYPHDFETYAYIGDYYWNLGNYYTNISKDSALYFYRMGLSYFNIPYRFDSLSNNYVDGLVIIHNSIASFYLNLGEYNNASIHYFEALKIKEKQIFYSQTEDNQTIKTLSSLYNNIANVKLVLKEYDDALSNYHKSLELKHKIADSTGIYTVIGMIAGVYIYKKEFDKAVELLKNVVRYFERTKKISLLAKNYNNLGICYAHLNDYENAIKAYKESLKYNQQIDNKNSIAIQYLNIAELYNKMYMKTSDNKYLQISYEHLKKAQKICDIYNL